MPGTSKRRGRAGDGDEGGSASGSDDEGMARSRAGAGSPPSGYKFSATDQEDFGYKTLMLLFEPPEKRLPRFAVDDGIFISFVQTADRRLWFRAYEALAAVTGTPPPVAYQIVSKEPLAIADDGRVETKGAAKRGDVQYYKKNLVGSRYATKQWKPADRLVKLGLLEMYRKLDVLPELRIRGGGGPLGAPVNPNEWFVSHELFLLTRSGRLSAFAMDKGARVPDPLAKFCSYADEYYADKKFVGKPADVEPGKIYRVADKAAGQRAPSRERRS